MKKERLLRLYHSLRLLVLRTPRKRTQYIRKHNILGSMGENCVWGPWLVPLYAELIRLHDNVRVHKTARIVTHDVINHFLSVRNPNIDFGAEERIGCVELMDNVYIGMNVTVMPNVRINKNCIISAGSVVSSDIPENSVASGVPAKVVGRFDAFMMLRRMTKNNNPPFRNQQLPEDLAKSMWESFENKRRINAPTASDTTGDAT